MITNEMKAKIAMLYYPCDVLHNGKVRKLTIPDIWGIDNSDTSMHFKLILKPLSEITDEDAIEVAKMHYEGREEMINNSPDRYIKNVKEHVLQPIGLLPYYFVDFLRSKSYMLPYMGIDLFEAGIAIPKK